MRKMFILAVVAFGLLFGLAPTPASAAVHGTHAVKTAKTHAGKKKGKHHKKHAKKHKKHNHKKTATA